jgi:hypothetical protein
MQANFTNQRHGLHATFTSMTLSPESPQCDTPAMAIFALRRANLRDLINNKFNGVAAKAAAELGMQASYMSRVFSDNPAHSRNIGNDLARKIERVFDLPEGWMDREHPGNGQTGLAVEPRSVTIAELPLLDTPTEVSGVASIVVSERWMYQHLGVADPSSMTVLTATGDAMGDTFHDGDVLFVDRSHTSISADAIYAIVLNGELWVRRVQRKMDGSVALIPDNERYETHLLDPETRTSIRVLGRVVGAWRWRRL